MRRIEKEEGEEEEEGEKELKEETTGVIETSPIITNANSSPARHTHDLKSPPLIQIHKSIHPSPTQALQLLRARHLESPTTSRRKTLLPKTSSAIFNNRHRVHSKRAIYPIITHHHHPPAPGVLAHVPLVARFASARGAQKGQ